MPPVAPQTPQQGLFTPTETPHDASGFGGGRASSSSRWSNAELEALIQLHSNLDMRRKGPNAPLWDDISTGMRRMGYNRSSKQCMDRWKHTIYYFKKVKDGNKKRPKTFPSYFHQLEALYRYKAAISSPAGAGGAASGHANATLQDRIEALTVAAPISQTAPQPHTLPPVAKNGVTDNDSNGHDVGGVSRGTQMQASNGGSVAGNRFVFSESGGHATAEQVIKLETNVHSRVATGVTYPAPFAVDINAEHVQEIGLKQAPVAAIRRTAAARSDSRSGYRGVSLYHGGRYLAQITEPGRQTRWRLGIFYNVDEAARAYDAAALRLYGASAKTNFEQPPTADDLPEMPVRRSTITPPPAEWQQ
jgi:hypothetical protein